MKSIIKALILMIIGGSIYCIIEILFRGYTHWSMFIVGGLCFFCIGILNEYIPWEIPMQLQMFWGAEIVTIVELISGAILNLALNLNVWDYSNMPLNFLGQICVPFMIIWYFLSAIAIVLDDYLRYWIFKEDLPHYTWR